MNVITSYSIHYTKLYERPIDLHLKAMEAMGATVTIHAGYVHAVAPEGLKGAHSYNFV